MIVLALDLGTRTGWAVGCGESTRFGAEDFGLRAKESRGARFLKFSNWLEATLKGERIDLIAFEEVRAHRGVVAAHVYGGFEAILLAISERLQIPCGGVAVGTIKKCLAGTGRATKKQMVKAAIARGWAVGNDHDALGVLLAARRHLVPEKDGFITIWPENLP